MEMSFSNYVFRSAATGAQSWNLLEYFFKGCLGKVSKGGDAGGGILRGKEENKKFKTARVLPPLLSLDNKH